MPEEHPVAAGVQELIDRLHEEGVSAGETEAARIISDAKAEADRIVTGAREEAERRRKQAMDEVQREREAARAALSLAVRDTTLEMKSQLAARLGAQVRRLVRVEMRDPEFIRRLVLAVASRAAEQIEEDRELEIRLARQLFDPPQAGEDEEAADYLKRNLLGASAESLREGVELRLAGDDRPGIRIRLGEEDAEIDLTEESVSAALLERLLPRFRAIVEGVEDAKL